MFEIPEHIAEALRTNKKRYINANLIKQAIKKTCKWCLIPLSGRRSSWCSDECVNKFLAISGRAEGYLEQRSKGRCELCSFPLKMLRQMHSDFWSIAHSLNQDDPDAILIMEEIQGQGWGWCFKQWHSRSYDRWEWAVRQHFEEIDHIVPLIEGGGTCPTNLRLLCLPCHQKETKALAGRRAKSKKGQLSLKLPSV